MKRRCVLLLFLTVVLVPVASGALWVRAQQRQYARNRQLIAALMKNDTNQALVLVNEGADPNARYNPPPATSLKLMLHQLLYRASVPADNSPTAFLLACGAGWSTLESEREADTNRAENLLLIKSMLDHHANLSLCTQERESALMGAVTQNHTQVAELLLTHGANVNDWNGPAYDTPLLEAAQDGYDDMIRLLLAHHADVHQTDYKGRTPLHRIVMSGAEANTVKLLLMPSEVKHRDTFDRTALWYAQEMHLPDIVALLQQSGKKP